MVDVLAHLSLGFQVALSPENLLYCFVGAFLGTLIGVLPGLGPSATIAILLPLTFSLPPIGSLIMLAGIYYGSQYGGSTTAILINLPGEASSVVTTMDGYQMARQGRAGEALSIAAIGSFIAGTIGTLLLAALAVPLVSVALTFGAPEYFSLMMFGLIGSVVIAHGSIFKAIAMILLGLVIGLIGFDSYTATPRMTFGISALNDGVGIVPLAMGVFGIAEILANLEKPAEERTLVESKVTGLWISFATFCKALPAILRGTALGSIVGILPGGGGALSAFASYGLERKLARNPERFGKGAIEGVAGPESANNAGAQTSFVPMLTLGLPPNASMALMIGAMIIQGITPGPLVVQNRPDLFWGLVVSMWIGNVMLLIINLPLIAMWVQLLKVPYRLMFPAILLFSAIGVYTLNNSIFEIWVLLACTVLGYLLRKFEFEAAPLVLAFILGPMVEDNFRRSMLLSRGSFSIFLERPISAAFLIATVILLIIIALPFVRRKRDVVFTEES